MKFQVSSFKFQVSFFNLKPGTWNLKLLLISELHNPLKNAACVRVVARYVKDDCIAGFQRTNYALELFKRCDGHTVDAKYYVAFQKRARMLRDYSVRVNVFDIEAANARQLSFGCDLRRHLLKRDSEFDVIIFGLSLIFRFRQWRVIIFRRKRRGALADCDARGVAFKFAVFVAQVNQRHSLSNRSSCDPVD